jgi:hypothetical protein
MLPTRPRSALEVGQISSITGYLKASIRGLKTRVEDHREAVSTRKVIRRDFDPAERTELDLLVLKAWRRGPAHDSFDIAELPEGMRATLVQAAPAKLGYVVQHGEHLVAAKAAQFSREVADATRVGVPQDPTYDDDRMLIQLIREALFHRNSERRHLAAPPSSPFGSLVTDEQHSYETHCVLGE